MMQRVASLARQRGNVNETCYDELDGLLDEYEGLDHDDIIFIMDMLQDMEEDEVDTKERANPFGQDSIATTNKYYEIHSIPAGQKRNRTNSCRVTGSVAVRMAAAAENCARPVMSHNSNQNLNNHKSSHSAAGFE